MSEMCNTVDEAMNIAMSVQYTLYDRTKPQMQIFARSAVEELQETSDKIKSHLDLFRTSLTAMPHLKCSTNDDFLLAFLRFSEYDIRNAQDRLERFCTFRTSLTEGYPPWFEDTPRRKKLWKQLVEKRFFAPLGFTQEGTLVVMIRCENINFDEVSVAEIQNAHQIWHDACLVDPRVQIGGICTVMDLSSLRKEDIEKLFDLKLSTLGTTYHQDCLPLKMKKLIYYNAPEAVKSFLTHHSGPLDEKYKSQIMVLDREMSPAFKAVPGLKDLTPAQYGGDNKLSFEEICDQQAEAMKSLADHDKPFFIAVDELKRPKPC